jgi:hypothetical protein
MVLVSVEYGTTMRQNVMTVGTCGRGCLPNGEQEVEREEGSGDQVLSSKASLQ